MLKDCILEDTKRKVIDILQRYYEIKTYIKIKEDEIRFLKETVLSSTELIDLYDCSESDLYRVYCYNNDSIVEIEVFRSLRREKKRDVKIRLIKADIERYQKALDTKKAILLMVDDIMKDMNSDYRLLIKLCYTERKITRDRFEDIVNRFNEGRRIKYSGKHIVNFRDNAVFIIAKRLKDMKIMSFYKIGE